jgi:hypothetical protein
LGVERKPLSITTRSFYTAKTFSPETSAQVGLNVAFNPGITRELGRANGLILENYNQQASNIKDQLQSANQLSNLEAQLQKNKTSNQLEEGLVSSEDNARNAQRRLQDLGSSIG